jgi:hypothetical protein
MLGLHGRITHGAACPMPRSVEATDYRDKAWTGRVTYKAVEDFVKVRLSTSASCVCVCACACVRVCLRVLCVCVCLRVRWLFFLRFWHDMVDFLVAGFETHTARYITRQLGFCTAGLKIRVRQPRLNVTEPLQRVGPPITSSHPVRCSGTTAEHRARSYTPLRRPIIIITRSACVLLVGTPQYWGMRPPHNVGPQGEPRPFDEMGLAV